MKIVGAMQVGGNYSWILPSSLNNLASIVDEIVVVGSGIVYPEIIKIINENSKVVDKHFQNKNEPRIEWNDMNLLLKMAQKRNADWILFMDSDETFEPRLKNQIQQLIRKSDVGMYKFKRFWLWKSKEYYRTDRPEKYSTLAYNTYLIKSSSSLRFPNPAGPFLKRIVKHFIGKEKLKPYFGREPITGIDGKVVETEIVVLHHAALNWTQFVKNQMLYAALLVKRQPRHSEQDIVEQQFKILDESTLELKPVKKEWFDSN
jgi:glycosyltransferase involved in cell wall biosynthesis